MRRLALAAALTLSTCLGTPALAAPAAVQAPPQLSATRQADSRPNIVLIMADDMGVECLNSYGGEYHTPNLDRLASEGMRFENAHAMPLCTPSRNRIMTGQDNWRNYQAFGYLAPGQVTFGTVLKQAGYATGIVGKWQLSGNGFDGRVGITPQAAGFDESMLWQLKVGDAKGSRYWGPTRVINGKTKISEDGFGPDSDNDFALEFIDRHKDQPFFLYYPMVLVHNPFVVTPASLDAQGAKDKFAGMMAYMDRKVGELLAKLEADGLAGNTVVIFTGDNGTNRQITSLRSGHAIQGGKGLPTANGTHVPLIVRAPGVVPAGAVSEGLFDFADVLPTLAELGHARVGSQPIDGVSQVPVLTGKKASVRDSIFMHYAPAWINDPARFVFDAHWKLYGDGRFVSVDPVSGVETQQGRGMLKGEAARRRTTFARILAQTPDGPLNTDKYPMCATQPSLVPGVPAIEAGCASIKGGLDS